MIPKIFHRIWLGSSAIPEQHEFWWAAWQRLYPDYEFVTWDERQIESLSDRHVEILKKAAQSSSFAMKSDILRIAILLEYGGIYIDTDMMPINRYDFYHDVREIIIGRGNNAIIAAKAESAIIGEIYNAILSKDIEHANPMAVVNLTGPIFIDNMLSKYDINYIDNIQFYPYHHDKTISTLFLQDLDPVYAAHTWCGSWYQTSLENKKHLGFLYEGNIQELQTGLESGKAPEYADLLTKHIALVRELRGETFRTIVGSHLIDTLNFSAENAFIFSAFKMCFYLKFLKKDISIWSIGCGDAIHNSPVSSAIAYYDAKIIFVDPAPHLPAKISGNFEKNTNTRIINKAYYPNGKSLAMNIVGEKMLSDVRLPEWVGNLSHPQISGLDSERVIHAHGGMTPEISKVIQEHGFDALSVPTIMAQDMLRESGGERPDIVSIEANYMEGLILPDLMNNGIKPKILNIVDTKICPDLTLYIENQGYVVVSESNGYVLAVLKDFAIEYSEFLFMEFGIRGIYDIAIRSILPDLNSERSYLKA